MRQSRKDVRNQFRSVESETPLANLSPFVCVVHTFTVAFLQLGWRRHQHADQNHQADQYGYHQNHPPNPFFGGGTDFFPGIKGIGQKTALDLIKKYSSIENILKSNVKVGNKVILIDPDLVDQIKKIFLNPDVKKDYIVPKPKKIDFERIEELLIEQHNFSRQRVENALERLRKLDSKKIQVSLDDFLKV